LFIEIFNKIHVTYSRVCEFGAIDTNTRNPLLQICNKYLTNLIYYKYYAWLYQRALCHRSTIFAGRKHHTADPSVIKVKFYCKYCRHTTYYGAPRIGRLHSATKQGYRSFFSRYVQFAWYFRRKKAGYRVSLMRLRD